MADFLTQGPTHLRLSPLHHLEDQFRELAGPSSYPGTVALREVPFTTQIGIRAEPGSPAHAALDQASGVGLPAAVGQVTGSPGEVSVLWLGPDEFLVVAAADSHDLLAGLLDALGEHPGQVVDLSANRAIIEVRGSNAQQALEKGVPADLHPRSFPENWAITTTLGPVPVLLWRTAADAYWLLPGTSFAQYTAGWLLDAVREFRAPAVT